MVFWLSMMPNSLKKNFLNQESKKTLYFYSKILPKSLILGWSIPRFSRLFSSRGIPRQQIPRFLVSHEEIRSVVGSKGSVLDGIKYFRDGTFCSNFGQFRLILHSNVACPCTQNEREQKCEPYSLTFMN